MRKHLKRIAWLGCLVCLVWLGGLLTDSTRLQSDILRLHVVGASDTAEDQSLKLQVRDAVVASLQEGLADLTDPQAAVDYVTTMLPKLEQAANQVLAAAGCGDLATVTLAREAFPVRDYDTFSLPSGVYQALRVTIGEGEGKNWWCVVFPQLCSGATSEAFVQTASTAQMPETLTGALDGEYEIRFWVLDQLGKLQNFFFDTSD